MNGLKNIIYLFIILIICTFDGYSMMNYRLPEKRAYGCFAAVTAFCLAINSYIVIIYGTSVLRNSIIFTIGLPYFLLILLITKDKIPQTVFNFWLWINIYEIIATFSAFVNDFTLKSYDFLTAERFILFCGYFILYNRFMKDKHKMIMEKLSVNWWIFSFIPVTFTVLICLVNYYFEGSGGLTRNYPILLTIHILMLLVYLLIFYTFKTVHDSMDRERLAQSMKEQITLQKKQQELYLQREETERIFRHDARHRDTVLLSYLDGGDINGAKEFLSKELTQIKSVSETPFCENRPVNTVLEEYRARAQKRGLEFSADIHIPPRLFCDETELCVMLSNLLENSTEAAKTYIKVSIKSLNNQISVNIKNDYDGMLVKDASGSYVTTKIHGLGLGLKSASAILRKNRGFLKINDENGVFNVYATLKNK